MWEFMRPSSQAFSRTGAGQSPSLSYSQATGRISFSAKSCAISRSAFCSSVSVKSTTSGSLEVGAGASRTRTRLTSQSTTDPEDTPYAFAAMPNVFEPEWEHEMEAPFSVRAERVGAGAGAERLGATVYEIDPGGA